MPPTESVLSKDRSDCTLNSLPTFVETRISGYHARLGNLCGNHLLHGRHPGADAIHLSSNDYLCLLGQPELVNAQTASLQLECGDLLMSAAFVHGDHPQIRLEKRLALHMGSEDGLLCQSGWNANVGLIQSLANSSIPVYLDMLAHASLWEGARSAEARSVPFLHNDASHLEKQIQKYGAGIVAVDSVYSTNGSVCPVLDMLEIAERTGSILVVDESHSLGTHGPQGAGMVAQLGLQERVHFITASLAKAFAGRAGFITCPSRFKNYFLTEARPAIFSSCLLHHELAWFDAALDFIRHANDRRQRLHANSRTLRQALSALGYNVSDGTEQIIALEVGTEPQTLVLRNALEENGIFGSVFCAPATPKNRSLVRLSINSGLTAVEMGRIIKVCEYIRDQVHLRDWSSTRRLHRR
jgi:CAI-1 autoinducer synthase